MITHHDFKLYEQAGECERNYLTQDIMPTQWRLNGNKILSLPLFFFNKTRTVLLLNHLSMTYNT
jgi:hypothetical protein